MKYFLETPNACIENMFAIKGWECCHSVSDADFVVFTGGADVNPAYYGESPQPYTVVDNKRDLNSLHVYMMALGHNKPMVGICRGAQFLTVMAGGKLRQHVLGHCGPHTITFDSGQVVKVASTHHQMMNLESTLHVLIAWADIVGEKDPEIVYYPEINALACQPHPEYPESSPEFVDLFFGLVEDLVND